MSGSPQGWNQVWNTVQVALDWITEAVVWTNSHGQIERTNAAFQHLLNGTPSLHGQALSALLPLSAAEDSSLHPVQQVLAGQILPPTPYSLLPTPHSLTACRVEIAGSPLYSANTSAPPVAGALFVLRTLPPLNQAVAFLQPATAIESRLAALIDANQRLQTEVQHWRQSEAALHASEARYRAIVEDQTELICRFLPDGTLSFANPAYLRYFGLSEISSVDPASHQFWDALPADDRQRVVMQVAQLSCKQTSMDSEHRVLLPTGEIRWQQWTVRAILNPEQQIIEYQAVGRDISDRKRAEAALVSSEERFRTLVQNASDVIVVIRIDGTSSYVSPSAVGVLGASAESLLGQDVFAPVHPEDLPRAESAFLTAVEFPEETVRVELRVRHPRRGWIDLECTCRSQLHEPSIQGVVINIRDISERKQAEIRLRQQQDFLKAVIDTNPNLIFVKDYDGRYLLANQAIASFYSTTSEQILNKKVTELYVDPDIAAEFVRQNQQILRDRQPLFIAEEKVLTSTFEERWLQWQKQPIYLPEQDVYAVLGVGVDITERKRAEAALNNILQGTASATGEAFFPVLAENLASALGVRHAVVSELKGQQLITLAFCSDHQLQPNITFELPEVPCCGTVIQQGFFCCPSQIQQRFPDLPILKELNAESYLGVVMQDDAGQPIGTLCIVDDHPIQEAARAEAILRIFAARAAAELERQRATTALQQLNQDLEARVAQRTQELIQSQATLQKQTHLLQALLDHMVEDITHRKAVEAQLRTSLQEKEVLLKEVHHRVKNNLQMVQSLLSLQARSVDDASVLQALTESQNRVKAMTLVHEKLYQSDSLARINFSDYVRSLTKDLLHSYVSHLMTIQLCIQVSDIELGIDTAIPCGLIISELFSNAVKYAFSRDRTGTITIDFSRDCQGHFVLLVGDDGIGIPPTIDPQSTKTLGLRLVYALTRQLRGTLELHRCQGSVFKIIFAKPS